MIEVGILAPLACVTACHAPAATTAPSPPTDPAIAAGADPTLCDLAGKHVVTFDLNRDGKPDVWLLSKAGALTCRQVDFDHDGRKDWMVAFDPRGNRIYERADLDYDGRWDVYRVFDPKTGGERLVEMSSDFDGALTVVRRDER